MSTHYHTHTKIVFAGTNGFPFGLAQMERQKLISKGLLANGVDVLVMSRYGTQEEGKPKQEFNSSSFEGISFIYASGNAYRPNSFFRRTLLKIKGMINELFILRNEKRAVPQLVLLVSTLTFYNLLYYRFISWLLRLPMVIDNIEYFSSMQIPKSRWVHYDNLLYDRYSPRFTDKTIAISDFLLEQARQAGNGKPVLKIPSIVDFSKFHSEKKSEQSFFLYCGQAAYIEVIEFILEAFEQMANGDYQLYLVSNGYPAAMERLRNRIKVSSKMTQIRLFSGLPFQELVDLYCSSNALLIPLRETKQDIARFPHKIGEYCAAAKPIVSTKVGEVAAYFRDGETALLAATYDSAQFAAKMQEVVEDPERAAAIGRRSFELGKKSFDHIYLGSKIKSFIETE